MSFLQVGNNLNEDAWSFLKHNEMEHSEETIEYVTLIAYAFKQYSLERGLKELGKKGETGVTEELSQLHMRDTSRPESSKHLTDK